MTNTLPDTPSVAIIGGGLAGLICGLQLREHGFLPTVFDTGEHGCGGRLGTRDSEDGSLKKGDLASGASTTRLCFEHAAQFFTASDPWFQEFTNGLIDAGIVTTWDGPVGTVSEGVFSPTPAVRYIGKNGMRGIAAHLSSELSAAGVEVRRPCWVSSMNSNGSGWKLKGNGQDQGTFDYAVIAHNGKCANKLLSPAGTPKVAAQMKALQLSSVWVLMVAFAAPVATPGGLEGAFVQDNGIISWVANNSKKLGFADGNTECWTIMSTPVYAARNKVPQENVPHAKSAQVTRDLLKAFKLALRLEELPDTVYTATQLWGAALPVNTPGVSASCILDQDSRAGICGDWVTGASMQAAAISGKRMAEQIALSRTSHASCGLLEKSTPLDGSLIGQFPGVPGAEQGNISLQDAAASGMATV